MNSRFGRAALLVWFVLVAAFDVATLPPRLGELSDFGSFVESGRAAARGGDPYAAGALTHRATVGGAVVDYRNLNPPAWLPLFEAFARPAPADALRGWRIAAAALFALAIALLAFACRGRTTALATAWALALPGIADTLASGQVYALVLAIVAAAVCCLEWRRFAIAGVLIGVAVALRPNLAVWPVLLLLAGHRRTALAALVAAAVLVALPVLRYGPVVYAEWWAAVRQVAWTAQPHNASLAGFAARCGVGWLAWPLAAALLAAVAAWAWRWRPTPRDASGAALLAALLASPLAWSTAVPLVLPAFFARAWSRTLGVAAVLLAVPTALVLGLGTGSPAAAAVLGALYPLGLLLALAVVTRTARPVTA